jgi:hypothetical protein
MELHDARTEVRGTASTFKDCWACVDIRSGWIEEEARGYAE